MREWIIRFLGLDDAMKIAKSNQATLVALYCHIHELTKYNRAVLSGIGRVLAQDKAFTQSEFSPERKAESDRLGQAAIDRLINEDRARRHSLGEL